MVYRDAHIIVSTARDGLRKVTIPNPEGKVINGVVIPRGPLDNFPVSLVEHPTRPIRYTQISGCRGNLEGFRRFLKEQFPLVPTLIDFNLKIRTIDLRKSYTIQLEGDYRIEVIQILKKLGF